MSHRVSLFSVVAGKTVDPRFSWKIALSMAAALLPAAVVTVLMSAGAAQLSAQNAATTVTVNATANQHAINPNIYGVGGSVSQANVAALNAPLNRIGGDLSSTYNWSLDAYNDSADWYFESYAASNQPAVSGASYDSAIQGTYSANVGSEPMVTIPMLPYIATVQSNATTGAASLWSYSIAKYGAQVACGSLAANDPYQTDAGSGCLTSSTYVANHPTDAYVANSLSTQQAFVQHLISKWGLSTTSTGIKYYVLDNEPSLWNSTHRDVNPNPVDYAQEYNNIVAYASAIRALDPNAKIVGPEEWSWWAMWESGLDQKSGTGSGSDYATHSNTYYYPWLLQQLYAYQQSSGIKMLDVLTVHCYTDASSNYNVATRELWDPNYVDPNWEGGLGLNGGIMEWIPLMQQWVNQYYPGLQIGCTEYNWGNQTTLAGATAQADAEGLYGLYGFNLATIWTAPPKPTFLAMQMYRNYDGNLSTFGNTSVSDTVADPDNLSSFAALRSTDNALTVMVINKQTGTTPVTIDLSNFTNAGTATAYQINSATQTTITNLGSVAVTSNAINFTAPSQSVTLFVIPAAPRFTSTATATPSSITASGSSTISFSVQDAGAALSNANVEVQLFNSSGTAVGTQTYTGQNFTASGTNSYTYTWTPSAQSPAVTATGNYTVEIGVFNSTWATNYAWNSSAATVALTSTSAATPTFSPAAGTYTSAQSVTISDATSGATIYYTTNGTTPTTSSTKYTAAISVGATQTIEAIAVASGYSQSAVGSAAYTINLSAATPTFSPAAGTYTSAQSVTISDTTSGATIYYTTNGTTPTTSSTKYTGAISVGATETIEAIAVASGYSQSAVGSAAYTINPTFTATATASPTSIATSGSSTISFSVKDTGIAYSNAIVEVQVFSSSGTAVGTQTYSGQNFTANGTNSYTYTWTPSAQSPAVTAAGNYTVEIGVFNSSWGTNFYWNSSAATITLQ